MTDQINDMHDDDLFEGAKDEFPSKFDLKDRLVVIYPTGKTFTRQGESGPYQAYETTTVVLDDGPKGWQAQVVKDAGELEDNLVPSVADEGAQVLVKFQWSAVGVASRCAQQLPGRMVQGKRVDTPGSIVGRINTRKNGKPGLAAPWGIAKPTEDEMALARSFREVCAAARAAIVAENEAAADEAAF